VDALRASARNLGRPCGRQFEKQVTSHGVEHRESGSSAYSAHVDNVHVLDIAARTNSGSRGGNLLSAGTQCDSVGAGAELCSHRRVDNTNRFKTSRCGIVEPQLEQHGHILCLRGACRCLLHEDLTLFIHFAELHVRRGSLGSLTASGKAAPGLPLPRTQHKRGVHVCYTRRRTTGFTSGFRLVLLWGDRGMCGLRTATARPVARRYGLNVSILFSTTPGGESRTEFVELPLRNPGGTLGPLVQPSITIKLRTQFFGA
jgi:hypothetical protein